MVVVGLWVEVVGVRVMAESRVGVDGVGGGGGRGGDDGGDGDDIEDGK